MGFLNFPFLKDVDLYGIFYTKNLLELRESTKVKETRKNNTNPGHPKEEEEDVYRFKKNKKK